MEENFIFVTGIARGGTSLIGRMVDAHGGVSIAIDAYLPLFRSLRNAILRHGGAGGRGFDPDMPLQDGHFTEDQRRWFQSLLAGNLDVPVDAAELGDLVGAFKRRVSDESGDIAACIETLEGADYRDLLKGALALIPKARRQKEARWIGVKDLWIVDLFPALARGFPAAKFILVLRDPRAIAASILGMMSIDPEQCAHTLSVLRHWRKAAACGFAFQSDPLFDGRFMILRYEDLIAEPDRHAGEISAFLGLDFDRKMADSSAYTDHATGRPWLANSTFDEPLDGISTLPAERWREKLSAQAVKSVEFACAADMRSAGYKPMFADADLAADPEIMEFLVADGERYCSWRCDSGDARKEFGFEAERRTAVLSPQGRMAPEEIRRAFLFEEYYEKLRAPAER
mgnify:CR=1 FL=1